MDIIHSNISKNGKVLIPLAFREALGLKDNDAIVIRLDDSCIVIESKRTMLQHIRHKLKIKKPDKKTLFVGDFIAARKENES